MSSSHDMQIKKLDKKITDLNEAIEKLHKA
jgi:hypothetical protein